VTGRAFIYIPQDLSEIREAFISLVSRISIPKFSFLNKDDALRIQCENEVALQEMSEKPEEQERAVLLGQVLDQMIAEAVSQKKDLQPEQLTRAYSVRFLDKPCQLSYKQVLDAPTFDESLREKESLVPVSPI
jgi:hypothetical protein